MAPGPVAEAVRINRDGLPVQLDRALITAGLIDVRGVESVRRPDGGEGQIDRDLVAVRVLILHGVFLAGLQAPITDAVGERNVGQRGLGERQVPEILGVPAIPDLVTLLVPEIRTSG